MQRIRRHIAALALLTCIAPMLGMTAAQAQTDWPKRNMKVVVPYPAGGSADAMGRMVANKLAKAFPKVSVVVENIPGGATVPGALAVLRDAADGHTLRVFEEFKRHRTPARRRREWRSLRKCP